MATNVENLSQARSLLTHTDSQAAAMVKPSKASGGKPAEPLRTRTLHSPMDRPVQDRLESLVDRMIQEQESIREVFLRAIARAKERGPQ